jgi:DNA-binding response OmpR family regulator
MNNTVPRNLRVLVVEGDPAALAATIEILAALGHWSTGVQSAEAAQAWYIEDAFDVLMLDIGLPALYGMDFFETLNAQHGLRVIFATGCIRPKNVAPGTGWLQKPFGLDDLENALQGTACIA